MIVIARIIMIIIIMIIITSHAQIMLARACIRGGRPPSWWLL